MVLCFINQKGGQTKSTSCFTIGNVLGDMGKRVLMIDLDPQGSLGVCSGVNLLEVEKSMYDIFISNTPLSDIIINVCNKPNLFLAPATIELAGAEISIINTLARENILKKALSTIKNDYDFILIDCSPSLGLLNINALVASEEVVIPVASDYLSYKGMQMLLDTIEKVKLNLNDNLHILGIISTLYDSRTLHAQEVAAYLEKTYHVLGKVGISTKVKDSVLEGKSITDIDPKGKVTKEYIKIVETILKEVAHNG